jgi:hypothetical protein
MAELTLVLKFKRKGQTQPELRSASRIRLDGRGSLCLVIPETGATEALPLSGIEEMAIWSLPSGPHRETLVA